MTRRLEPDAALRERILTQGCYSPQENERIFNKWFARGPRHQFQAVNEKYHLTERVLCDIGSSYGMNILYTAPGSYGIEIDEYPARFSESLGLTIYRRDFAHAAVDDLPKVDAVWCSAVLEHVESVHIFLRKIALLLKPGGLVVVYVPTIPLIPALRHIPALRSNLIGYLYGDHINAFTPSTLRFTCERAGFETLEVSPFMPGPLRLLNHIPLANRLVDGCTYIGRKLPDWDYPEDTSRQAADTGSGFTYRKMFYNSSDRT